MTKNLKSAFTLAEVLITLGVIGVVAAVTMPTLITNIQERVRKEQVRTVKYKLTKATDKMNSLGKIGRYESTEKFVNELKNHLTIAKICQNNELDKCWPSESINAYNGDSTTLTSFPVKDLKQGTDLKALAIGTRDTQTVGIITGDGVPMLLVYSPVCSGFDEAKTYTWSVEDGKPVTNATTNCISAIFDINGTKGPNKIGQDVRTLNSVFGAVDLGPVSISQSECRSIQSKYNIKECGANPDFWAGGVKKCADIGLHLPSFQTLAVIATARYADPTIGPYTFIFGESFGDGCREWVKDNWAKESAYYLTEAEIRCQINTGISEDQAKSAYTIQNGDYWSNLEFSDNLAYGRSFTRSYSHWYKDGGRTHSNVRSLCVGD